MFEEERDLPLDNKSQIIESFNILDTKPESEFDLLTEYVANYFQVEYCFICFLTEDRQWFKSHYGIDFNQTPLSEAFCTHTITKKSGNLVVSDLPSDARFENYMFVANPPHLKFYASQVIQGTYDEPFATICILSASKINFTPVNEKELKFFAQLCFGLLEKRKAANAPLSDVKHTFQFQTLINNITSEYSCKIELENPIQNVNIKGHEEHFSLAIKYLFQFLEPIMEEYELLFTAYTSSSLATFCIRTGSKKNETIRFKSKNLKNKLFLDAHQKFKNIGSHLRKYEADGIGISLFVELPVD